MREFKGLPEWLEVVRDPGEGTRLPFPDVGAWLSVPRPGEIRGAQPMDETPGVSPRLVVVLDVDIEGDPWVNALLVAETVDVAADRDIRLDPDETGLSFPILVETDIVGPLFVVQLGPALATLQPPLVEELRAEVYGGQRPTFAGRRGLPLKGRGEARWRWKEQELAVMHEMAYPCMELELRDDVGVTFIDPVLTRAMGSGEAPVDLDQLVLRLLAVAPMDRPAAVSMVPEGITAEEGLASWITHLSPDLTRAIEPAITGALSAPATEALIGIRWEPAWPSDGMGALSAAIRERARRGLRATRVVSRRSDWPHAQGGEAVALFIEGVGLVQVKPELIDTEAA